MRRSFILGCCPICDRYEHHMKSSRDGARKHRQMCKTLSRKLRRELKQKMHREDYEPVLLAGYRWF